MHQRRASASAAAAELSPAVVLANKIAPGGRGGSAHLETRVALAAGRTAAQLDNDDATVQR